MLSVVPSGKTLGAQVRGVDLSLPLSERDFAAIREAIGRFGVLCFPDQNIEPAQQKIFAERFGHLQKTPEWALPGLPEVSTLSNVIQDGKKTGYTDAGMAWHKDMTSLKKPGFATFLYAVKVPLRDGKSLGSTRFINARAAYKDLSDDLKRKLEGAIGVNSAEYYNAYVRALGSERTPFEKMAKRRLPTLHPIVMIHPITGEKVLYCDPGHVESIEGWPAEESQKVLAFLQEHQVQSKFEYVFDWTERDLLMWDNLGTLHRATLDYGPDEPRFMTRCMVSQPGETDGPMLQ